MKVLSLNNDRRLFPSQPASHKGQTTRLLAGRNKSSATHRVAGLRPARVWGGGSGGGEGGGASCRDLHAVARGGTAPTRRGGGGGPTRPHYCCLSCFTAITCSSPMAFNTVTKKTSSLSNFPSISFPKSLLVSGLRRSLRSPPVSSISIR